MNKEIYKSKTVWGFGIAGLVTLGHLFGAYDASVTVEVITTLAGLLGLYGLRDAM